MRYLAIKFYLLIFLFSRLLTSSYSCYKYNITIDYCLQYKLRIQNNNNMILTAGYSLTLKR